MPPSFGNVLNNLVGGAVKTIDNAMKTQASSGNHGADNPIQALLKQYANQPAQSFAQPVQQQRQALPQQPDTQTQVPAAYQQAYDSAQQIMQSGISNGVQQDEAKKEDKAKRNQTMANAISGLLAGAAGPGAKNMLGVLIDNMDPEDANAEEMEGKGKSEMKPDVTTEGSQDSNANEEEQKPKGPRHMSDVLEEGQNKTVESDIRFPESSLKSAPISESSGMIPYESALALSPSIEDFSAKDFGNIVIPDSMLEGIVSLSNAGGYSPSESAAAANDIDDIVSNWSAPQDNPENLLTEKEVDRIRKQMSDDTLKEKESPWDNENWFTDAYGYMNTGVVPITWDTLTGGKGYKEILDNQDLVYDENYDKILKPEKELSKDRQEERQANLEDEMRAMSEAQAFMLENPGATNGTYEGNRRMSQGGEAGKYAQEYGLGAEDLESMSDTELILNELARNEEFRNNMVENYGDLWNVSDPEAISALLDAQANLNNPFLSDYLVMNDNGYDDKRQMTQDLFLDSGMDPVVRTQLLQRIYNQNQKEGQDVDQLADILRRDARGEELSQEDKDYLTQNIMDTYFANPIDFAEWALSPDSTYAIENPFNYADQVAWMGSAAAMNPTIAATISDLGLDAADLGAYLAAGNQLNLGNTWMDRNNGPLTEHWYDYLGQLLNDAGYASEWNRDIAKSGDKEAEKLKKRFTDSGKSHNMGDLLTTFMQNAGDPNAIAQALNIVGSEDMYDPSFGDIPFDLLADYRGVPISQYGLGTSRYIHPKSINESKEA